MSECPRCNTESDVGGRWPERGVSVERSIFHRYFHNSPGRETFLTKVQTSGSHS